MDKYYDYKCNCKRLERVILELLLKKKLSKYDLQDYLDHLKDLLYYSQKCYTLRKNLSGKSNKGFLESKKYYNDVLSEYRRIKGEYEKYDNYNTKSDRESSIEISNDINTFENSSISTVESSV